VILLALVVVFTGCAKLPETEKSADKTADTKAIIATNPAGAETKDGESKSVLDKDAPDFKVTQPLTEQKSTPMHPASCSNSKSSNSYYESVKKNLYSKEMSNILNKMNTGERMNFIKSLTADDIPNINVNPSEFLSKLHPDSRQEFLSVMTPAQQQQFMNIKTSSDFFNLLTPDQRAYLSVKFQPKFSDHLKESLMLSSNLLPESLSNTPLVKSTPPASQALIKKSYSDSVDNKKVLKSSKTNTVTKPSPYKDALIWNTCYYKYSATIETDRDGTPCTYGPYPCGSSIPPNPPGKEFETPFCPGPDADNYGCGALAYQKDNVTDVTSCPGKPKQNGIPLEHICNATNNDNCSYGSISPACFTSVVTNCDISCITDHYVDPTGDKITVPIKSDGNNSCVDRGNNKKTCKCTEKLCKNDSDCPACTPCIQQSDPGACGGINCPCPGLYISQTGFRSPNWSAHPMNPDNYLNALLIPFASVPKSIAKKYHLKMGMFVVASAVYDKNNPTEDPKDWVAGVLADVGGKKLGEISYAMNYALGFPKGKVTFRIYPQATVSWPVTMNQLDDLKTKVLGVCCPGDLFDQCHANENQGKCINDPNDPNAGSCKCTGDWIPDVQGDCTWKCPGSDQNSYTNTTDSGYQECSGHGHCVYDPKDKNGTTLGNCICDAGYWGNLENSCNFRDCVRIEDWENLNVQPCYGKGTCISGNTINDPGYCTDCNDGWGGEYCDDKTCLNNCSGHGTCTTDKQGNPVCACDVANGWFGSDCSQRGCITADGKICCGHGQCQLDGNGNPFCNCPAEWGGSPQTGDSACCNRKCPNCDPIVADCNHNWNGWEILCLCICGHNCGRYWECECKDPKADIKQGCRGQQCCEGAAGLGQCCENMKTGGLYGYTGGGKCNNGSCQCYDNYDPNRCCCYPLQGGSGNNIGHPCPNVTGHNLQINCPQQTFNQNCSSCDNTASKADFTLTYQGNNIYIDQNGNTYSFNPGSCRLILTQFGDITIGHNCGQDAGKIGISMSINGNSGIGKDQLICASDCVLCGFTQDCTVTVQ